MTSLSFQVRERKYLFLFSFLSISHSRGNIQFFLWLGRQFFCLTCHNFFFFTFSSSIWPVTISFYSSNFPTTVIEAYLFHDGRKPFLSFVNKIGIEWRFNLNFNMSILERNPANLYRNMSLIETFADSIGTQIGHI